jgi:hypothetical protein
MSDSIMPLDEAREWVAQDKSTRSTARAARTIVHQAEQIERLQAALRQADKDAFWVSADRYVGPGPLVYEEPDWGTYSLLPDDMETPK